MKTQSNSGTKYLSEMKLNSHAHLDTCCGSGSKNLIHY